MFEGAQHTITGSRSTLAAGTFAAFDGWWLICGEWSQVVAKVHTVKDVAEALKKGQSSIRRMIAEGELRAVKIGGSVRILDADLQNYLDSLTYIVPESPKRKPARQYRSRGADQFDRSVFLN